MRLKRNCDENIAEAVFAILNEAQLKRTYSCLTTEGMQYGSAGQ